MLQASQCSRRAMQALLVAMSVATSAGWLAAQSSPRSGSGAVAGRVSDEKARPLAGAIVRVVGSGATAGAGRDGAYRISGLAAGTASLIVRYVGYQPETLSVAIASGRTTIANVAMRKPAQQLERILVESSVAGQAAALNQQRAATNISSVVDAELMGRLPDRNLAEALGRVPGVALVRDQGEGRFVQIRGTNATLNSLSIDGMRMPSPDPGTRQTPMDVIPSDMVAAIQVNKTLTPDMDADAIGGNVNLITPAPRAGRPVLNINVAGGENLINNGRLANASGVAGRRFGRDNQFGLLVGGNYYQNERGSQNYEMSWCVETTCTGVAATSAADAPAAINLRNYSQIRRTRYGGNLALDYRFTPNHTVFAKGLYSRFADSEQRYVTTVNFGSGRYTVTDANTGTVAAGRMDKELRLRPVAQQQMAVQFGGTSVFGTGTLLDYTGQVARAREDRPQTLTMVFRQSNMGLSYDVSDEDRPRFTVTSGAENDASRFTYNSLRQQTRHALDDDRSGRVNLTQPFTLGSVRGALKLGGSARLKDRSSRDTSNRFLTTYKAGSIQPGTLPVTLAALQGAIRKPNFLDNDYNFGPQASASGVSNFFQAFSGSLNVNAAQSSAESNSASYDITENVYAGYAMLTLDAGPLHVIPGVRFEQTKGENTGNTVTTAGSTVTVVPVTRDISYANALPSITATLNVTDRTLVRAAVTSSLVRPDFSLYAPSTIIPDGTGVVATLGNPSLKPIRATNYDLMLERYFGSVGFVSLGVFRKDLTDYIFTEQRAATTADGLPAGVTTIAQARNSRDGTLDGFEVAWQQNLTMLPGVLSGLGVNANYTRTSSSTTLPSRDGVKARLPGQAGNAGNAGVFYERSLFALRAGYNFADKYLEVVGASAATDIYVASRGQLDVSGSLQLPPNARLFFELNNLTNQPLRRYIGKPTRSWQPGNEYYRSWGMVGVRVQL